MKKEQFKQLWEKRANEWYEKATVSFEPDKGGKLDVPLNVSEFCEIRGDMLDKLYDRYDRSKDNAKEIYFYGDGNRLNKYKRAAVLTYVVAGAAPLKYKGDAYEKYFESRPEEESVRKLPDQLFLKQRLAFYVGLGSIIMEYDRDEYERADKPIFRFPVLSDKERLDKDGKPNDDFLLSVYKDLYFAEVYHNRNILTLGNLFWALTDSSALNQKRKPESTDPEE